MKRFHTISTVAALVAATLLASCSREEMPVPANEEGQALMIAPSLLDMHNGNITTRAAADLTDDDVKDDKFNENKIERLDVFFFKKADGTFVKDFHIAGLTPDKIVTRGNIAGYQLTTDWLRDGLTKDIPYTVYVIANSTNPAITGGTDAAKTIDGLKSLSTTDPDIYRRYKESVSDNPSTKEYYTYSSTKTFLMNTTVDSWEIKDFKNQLIGYASDVTDPAPLVMQRAAVKFVVDLSLSENFLKRLEGDKSSYGEPSWKYINFNTATAEIPEGTTPKAALQTRGSGEYLEALSGTDGHYIVTTYAYPQDFSDAASRADKAPALLVSYTATLRTTNEETGVVTEKQNYHYYYIPLCEAAVTATERNKLYKVNAVISSYGSFEEISNNDVELTYEVKNWTATSADVNAYALDYLLANPTRYAFKGGAEGEYLSKTFKYYASGAVTVKRIKAYYKNASGAETDVTGDGSYSVSTPANGEFTVTSKIPTNGTFRTLEIELETSGGKSQTVIIRHYPEDYVSGITSSWCSYDDDDWAALGVSGRTYRGASDSNDRLRFQTSNDNFSATMYENGYPYYLTLNGERGSLKRNSTVNNQMYVLQITSANDTYRIGRPTLTRYTGNVYGPNGNTPIKTRQYSLSNDNVLSPAFMLASQLTNLSGEFPDNVRMAALHCALYKEVDSEGNSYTGWRLPTKAEIEYMIENQTANTQVMIRVLTGWYYYSLDGDVAYNPGHTGDEGPWVRCVRDLTDTEIARLNEF